MPTIEVIQKQPPTLEDVRNQVTANGSELSKLKFALDNEQRALSSATEKYNTACRDLAMGKDANIETLKTEMDRTSQKIVGLKSLITDHEDRHERLAPLLRELDLKSILRHEAEELTRLQGVQLEKQGAFEAAQKALDIAQGARNEANYNVDHFRRQCELRQQRREKGLE